MSSNYFLVFWTFLVPVVNCYLEIHESNVWIPIFNSNISEPLFFYIQDFNFLSSQYSLTELNRNPSNLRTGGLTYNFTKAYPLGNVSNYYRLYSDNNDQVAAFRSMNFVVLELRTKPSIYAQAINRTRWIKHGQNFHISFFKQIVLNETKSFRMVYLLEPQELRFVQFENIDQSFSSISVTHQFVHRNLAYSFGSRVSTDGTTYDYIARVLLLRNESYSEIYFTNFRNNFGYPDQVRFASSEYIHRNVIRSQLSSEQLFISYRNGSDRILVVPFGQISAAFGTVNTRVCTNTEFLWTMSRQNNRSNCVYSVLARNDFFFKQIDFSNFNSHIFSFTHNRIVDFVPLAMKLIPGYLLLILSSNENYDFYQYSIQFLDSNNQLSNQAPLQRFVYSARPDDRTKIYYYDKPYPQVLITINQYHYNEPLVLCPFLSSSCLACMMTKFFDDNTTYRFCSWEEGVEGHVGSCQADRTIEPTGNDADRSPNVHYCFTFRDVTTVYSPFILIFSIELDIIGYHESMITTFPISVQIFNEFNIIRPCDIVRIVGSKVSIRCYNVQHGEYRLRFYVYRASTSSNYEYKHYLYTISHFIETENRSITEPGTTEPITTPITTPTTAPTATPSTTPITSPQPTEIIIDPTGESTPDVTQPEFNITSTESPESSESSRSSMYLVFIIFILIFILGYFIMLKKKSHDDDNRSKNIQIVPGEFKSLPKSDSNLGIKSLPKSDSNFRIKSLPKSDSNLRIKSASKSLLALKSVGSNSEKKSNPKYLKDIKSNDDKKVPTVKSTSSLSNQLRSKSTIGSELDAKGLVIKNKNKSK
ncbi:uncharacterized protein LOC128387845 [Panonychus citri]|uniref:uncharacterized protein LOC128387845 n=1 Tax=Panonychus citri TaxID=50023 RepID=UPI002307D9BD|nr:uncharacterized protein LOC128387845 [Panonychus citri]